MNFYLSIHRFWLAAPAQQLEGNLSQLLGTILLLLGLAALGVTLGAVLLASVSLLPGLTQRSRQALQQTPWRAFFVGLANYLFLGLLAIILIRTEVEILALAGILISSILALVTMIGLGGLVQLLAQRLATLRQEPTSPTRQLLWSILVLELAGLFPIFGWFVLTPIWLLLGFGAALLGWRRRKPATLEETLAQEDEFAM